MVRSRISLSIALLLFVLVWDVSPSFGHSDRIKGARPFESSAPTVELFQAVEQGMLSAKVIPHDSTECRVLIANRSDQVLNVQLPETLAAVPVVAQQIPLGPAPAQNNPTAPQRLGVGNPFGLRNPLQMGPNMQGNPLMNPGNQPLFAPFSIAPEKVAQLKLPAVCLDHGHPDPRPAMRYHLVPLAAIGGSKDLESVCRLLGCEQISQRVAQAAAWHICNDKTWEQMEEMIVRRLGRPDVPFFTSSEIRQAKQLLEEVDGQRVSKAKRSPGASSQIAEY